MKKVYLENVGENKGHYAPGVISNGNLYVSGQLSIDLDTRVVPEPDIDVHMNLALHNLERVLNAAGCSRNDVVMCRVYVSDMKYWDKVNEIYREFFGDHTPARIVITVPDLHFGCLVEIEAVAEMPAEKIH